MIRKTALVSMLIAFGVIGFVSCDHHLSTETSVSADLKVQTGFLSLQATEEQTAPATDAAPAESTTTTEPAPATTDAPAEETPASTSTETAPAESAPATETPAAEQPAAEKSAETPATEQPASTPTESSTDSTTTTPAAEGTTPAAEDSTTPATKPEESTVEEPTGISVPWYSWTFMSLSIVGLGAALFFLLRNKKNIENDGTDRYVAQH